MEHTKSVLVLEDDDVAHLFDGEYNVYRVDRESEGNDARAVDRVTMTLQIEVSQIMKGESPIAEVVAEGKRRGSRSFGVVGPLLGISGFCLGLRSSGFTSVPRYG